MAIHLNYRKPKSKNNISGRDEFECDDISLQEAQEIIQWCRMQFRQEGLPGWNYSLTEYVSNDLRLGKAKFRRSLAAQVFSLVVAFDHDEDAAMFRLRWLH